MSVAEILEQVRALAPHERKAVAKAVIDLIDEPVVSPANVTPAEHWGKNLLRLLDELGPLETAHPEIDDPVEWVDAMRSDARERRLNRWDSEQNAVGEP